jgi:hypothetical protein
MCTVVTDVLNVLTIKVAHGESFTAFDVTKTLRDEGHRVRHRDVRMIVHTTYETDGLKDYDRTYKPVGKSGEMAFVYHPQNPLPSPVLTVQVPGTASDTDGTDSDDTSDPDDEDEQDASAVTLFTSMFGFNPFTQQRP